MAVLKLQTLGEQRHKHPLLFKISAFRVAELDEALLIKDISILQLQA